MTVQLHTSCKHTLSLQLGNKEGETGVGVEICQCYIVHWMLHSLNLNQKGKKSLVFCS